MNNFISICLILLSCSCNLIRGGDFQEYANLYQEGIMALHYIDCPFPNWICVGNQMVVFLRFFQERTTTVLNIVTHPYSMCQQVSLIAGKKYRIGYSLYNDYYLNWFRVTFFLNDVNISSLFIGEINKFGQKKDQFTAQISGINMLCFNETQQRNDQNIHEAQFFGITGGFIDNITLVEVKHAEIYFTFTILQTSSQLILTADTIFEPQICAILKNKFTIRIPGQIFDDYYCQANKDGLLEILLTPDLSFAFSQFQFTQIADLGQNQNYAMELAFQVEKSDKFFHYLSSSFINQLTFIKIVAQLIAKASSAGITTMKLGFCSGFILSLIGFQSLSVFYIFLNINTVPQFTKNVYEDILSIQFEFSGLSNLLAAAFDLKFDPFQLQIQTQTIPQMVTKYKGSDQSLASYGYSSLFINNNLENFLILVFLLIKIFLLTNITKYLNKLAPGCFNIKISSRTFCIMIVLEFVSMSPSFIISALSRLQYAGYASGEYLQKAAQIIVLFLAVVSIAIYYIESSNFISGKINTVNTGILRSQKKNPTSSINKQPKKLKPTLSQNKKMKKQFSTPVSSMILFLTIPLCSLSFSQKIFFVINSFAIAIRVIGFFYLRKYRKCWQNVIEFFINSTWLIHHAVFLAFYAFSQSEDQTYIVLRYQGLITCLGFVVIVTVVLGCALQSAKFLIQIFQLIIEFFKSLRNTLVIKSISKQRKSQFRKKREEQQYIKADIVNFGKY